MTSSCIVVARTGSISRTTNRILIGRIAALRLAAKRSTERPWQRYPEPSLSQPRWWSWRGRGRGRGGCGGAVRSKGWVGVVRVIGGKLEAANGAGAVKVEPGEDAILVEDVFAGELLGGSSEVEVVHADGALGPSIGGHHVGGDGDVRERGDGGLGGRRGAVAVGVVLGELLDELLEARADEVVAEADPPGPGGGAPEGEGGGGALEDDLDGGAAREEAGEVIMEEVGGVEVPGGWGGGGGGGGGPEEGGEVARVAEVEGWGGEGEEGVVWQEGARVGVGVGVDVLPKLLDEASTAERAEDVGVGGGGRRDGDGAVALVAVEALSMRRRRRHRTAGDAAAAAAVETRERERWESVYGGDLNLTILDSTRGEEE